MPPSRAGRRRPYTLENAATLKASDLEPTYPNLRLAFLLGVGGAIKVLRAPPDAPLRAVLPRAVLIANPFMVTMTARGLALRSAREVNQPITTRQVVDVPPGMKVPRRAAVPDVVVRCNQLLPSCRRWVALQRAKLRTATAKRQPAKAPAARLAARTATAGAAARR